MKIPFGRFGPKADPRGAHCTLAWGGRTLLGEIVGIERREFPTAGWDVTVRFLNGEPWPVKPAALAVDVLERTYEPLDDGPADKPCRCARCIAPEDCPSCQAVNGLCRACDDHFRALADAAEAESAARGRP